MSENDFVISARPGEAISYADPLAIFCIDHAVVQERDTYGDVLPIDEKIRVSPSKFPTEVRVRSYTAGNRQNSPAYIATVRRRKMQALVKQIRGLESVTDREDFEMHVLPIVEALRACLVYLAESPTEGNTREIVRLVRDSFMDGRWDNFRKSDTREIVIKILNQAANSEETTPDMAFSAFDVLEESKLLPEMKLPIIDGEET